MVGGILANTSVAPGFTAPGIAHTVGRLRRSIIKDLKLATFGLELLEPAVRVFAPQPDGSAVTFWGDASRTTAELESRSPHDAAGHLVPEPALGVVAYVHPGPLREARPVDAVAEEPEQRGQQGHRGGK